ncbi:MAG TPA: ABC transporter substrate-binding protein [Chloroflexota bacterium]|nr:ABC transporter substrate-binding protein [Chloroflexota bacterium]
MGRHWMRFGQRRNGWKSTAWPAVLSSAVLLAACGGAAAPAGSVAPPASPSAAISSASAASSGAAAKPAAAASGSTAAKPAGSAAAKPAISIAPAAAGPGTPLVMSYSEIVGVHVTEWGAKDAGIFDKNGLNVEIRLIESSLGVSALLSGQVQIASMGGSEMLAADVNGADLVAYATMSPVYPYKFEATAAIKTPADLKGKKIGISRFGSSSDVATRAWLKTVGINPSDVKFVQIGSLAARTAALKSGALDGAMASATSAPALESTGLHPLVDLAAEKIPAVNDCIVAQRTWAAANHGELQKFIDSVMQAKVKEKADKAFTLGVFKKYLKVNDPKELQANYDYYLGQVIPDAPYPATSGFKDAIEALATKNPKAAGFDASKVVDPSFVKSAVDRGMGKG